MIRHIVTWKLAAQDAAEKAAAFDRLAEGFAVLMPLVPEVKQLSLGRDLDETASNWDVVLIVDFATTTDLETYQSHPAHDAVRQIVRAVTAERVSIDFEL